MLARTGREWDRYVVEELANSRPIEGLNEGIDCLIPMGLLA
jgi:hypothetical protein